MFVCTPDSTTLQVFGNVSYPARRMASGNATCCRQHLPLATLPLATLCLPLHTTTRTRHATPPPPHTHTHTHPPHTHPLAPAGLPEPVPVVPRGGGPHQRRQRHLHLRAYPAPARGRVARWVDHPIVSGNLAVSPADRPLHPVSCGVLGAFPMFCVHAYPCSGPSPCVACPPSPARQRSLRPHRPH